MNDRTRTILTLSDSELVLWWSLFGYCPHPTMEWRLRRLLFDVTGRTALVAPVPIDPVVEQTEVPTRKVG